MKYIVWIWLFACPIVAAAKDIFQFRQGLASGSAHQYGREAMYADTLLFQLISGKMALPEAGKIWFEAGPTVRKWVPVSSDTSGTFRHPSMYNGYLYLTYTSEKARPAILTVSGHAMVYVNGAPHAGDPYSYGWMHLPVLLKKGLNEFYIRTGFTGRQGGVKARLETGGPVLRLSDGDATLPSLVRGSSREPLWAGVVCLNASAATQKNLSMEATLGNTTLATPLPALPAYGSRKMPVQLPVPDGDVPAGELTCTFRLKNGKQTLDSVRLAIQVVEASQHQKHTFISGIDSSVQYYAVAPQLGGPSPAPALYFSVHGAEVEAISQARAYQTKTDGPVVAPTNRRPRGFNWEDWGRLDALEVLNIAQQKFNPDPTRMYLTGHSMGGHGTWFLGATYAGRWAGIAPCAGYPVLQSYGSADGRIPTEAATPGRKMLLRASNPSNVLELAKNYKSAGVYIYHGDADPTVSVEYARQMRKVLAEFHSDFAYYEYPGGSHWFGDISVDWPALFSFLRQHKNRAAQEVNSIDFTTAAPSISSRHYWVEVLQQEQTLQYSRVQLLRDTLRKTVTGTTSNIRALAIYPHGFKRGDTLGVRLDQSAFSVVITQPGAPVYCRKAGSDWQPAAAPAPQEKGTRRGAGFKDAFQHHMLLVYGTAGTAEENAWALQKARYDAESWYYRGNGAVDMIPDTDFDALKHGRRGIILYGNATTNRAFRQLVSAPECFMDRGKVTLGSRTYTGDDWGGYLVWPNRFSDASCIAMIGGTGLRGMRAADANQYFAGGSGFPDFMIFSSDMALQGEKSIKAAGFYNHQWKLAGDFVSE